MLDFETGMRSRASSCRRRSLMVSSFCSLSSDIVSSVSCGVVLSVIVESAPFAFVENSNATNKIPTKTGNNDNVNGVTTTTSSDPSSR